MKTKYSKPSGTGGRKIPKTLSGIETALSIGSEDEKECAGKYLKPYQGLKLFGTLIALPILSRKIPKTLSGIETRITMGYRFYFTRAGKYLKPYQGLKLLSHLSPEGKCALGRKIPKTLSGIETKDDRTHAIQVRRKIPKTLSGIETTSNEPDRPLIFYHKPENT